MSDALLLACPSTDLGGAAEAEATYGLALLPAGGVGDLARCSPRLSLYLVAIDEDGARPAATWSAQLLGSVPLTDPTPEELLPPTWHARHRGAYAEARAPLVATPSAGEHVDDDDDDDLENQPRQIFIPVSDLNPLDKSSWLFTNELVPKQARGGRRFAPLVPTLVRLPD